jgi:hypothetical protein
MPSEALETLQRLVKAGAQLSAEQIDAALAGPAPPGTVGADGRLRVTQEQLAPNSAWHRENRALVNKHLASNTIDLVD